MTGTRWHAQKHFYLYIRVTPKKKKYIGVEMAVRVPIRAKCSNKGRGVQAVSSPAIALFEVQLETKHGWTANVVGLAGARARRGKV